MVWHSNYVVLCEYKSLFVDVCNTLCWQECLIYGLTSEDLPWTYFYLVALFPRFTCVTFDAFVTLKIIKYKNLFNTRQHDFNIKQDILSLYLHARKPRMSRGPRWTGVWTLDPIHSKKKKKRKLNDSWFSFFLKKKTYYPGGKKTVFTRSELPSIPAAPCISEETQVQCHVFTSGKI